MQQLDIKDVIQQSPVAHAQANGHAQWTIINGMDTVISYADSNFEAARKEVLGIADVSCLARYGVKGPKAEQWLADRGVAIPTKPNAWVISEQKTLLLRLGSSEFLVEDQLGGTVCSSLFKEIARSDSVYKVPRADAAFIISGSQTLNLFSELCSLDLCEKSFADHDVILTQFAEISATVIRQTLNKKPIYRVWCDGTYGSYMWEVLLEIAVELGGGAVGISQYQS